jgi:2-polyprenyl-3-methyl-5-hydroxy-6-metoxy-1,4-benzoquinol methylase
MKLYYGNILKDDKYVQNRFEKYYLLILDYLKSKLINNNLGEPKARRITQTISVLDIGGYTADMLTYLKYKKISTKIIDYLVIDADRGALKIAKKRGANIMFANLHEKNALSKINKKFDIILCTEVLEHLLYPEDILKELKKLVKKDGVVIISLPNENTIFHRIYSVLGIGIDAFAFKQFKHLHLPTISQSRKFVKKYFTIEKELYYINFSGKFSHFSIMGRFFSAIPEPVLQALADIFPNLLARGVVFKLKK